MVIRSHAKAIGYSLISLSVISLVLGLYSTFILERFRINILDLIVIWGGYRISKKSEKWRLALYYYLKYSQFMVFILLLISLVTALFPSKYYSMEINIFSFYFENLHPAIYITFIIGIGYLLSRVLRYISSEAVVVEFHESHSPIHSS